jgi:catechol 2,3-dioxygenase-like lactoylglutathione lyase family enzyme
MLQHVTRQVPPAALDACVDFYGLVGFAPVPVPPGIEGRAIWLEAGATQIHLMPVDGAGPDGGHVAVVASPYQVVVDGLQSAGYEVEPRRQHWGAERAYVRDPAGNLVELMAAPPPVRSGP